MEFLWPSAFLFLLLVPLLIGLYLWMQRRRKRFAVRYSSLALVRAALPEQSRLRRYLPMMLFSLALLSLVVSLSRPVTVTTVPAGRATVMLVLDVSRSMNQQDIYPSRLAAAKQAAMEFVAKQKDNNQVGIVAFAGTAQLVQQPSSDVDALRNAIRNLTTARRTAVGSGIMEALSTIAEYNQDVALPNTGQEPGLPAVPGSDRGHQPDIIVLLTDGNSNAGVDPIEAAQQAAASGIRVYTIGYGTLTGAGSQYGWGWGRRGLDEEVLKTIASITGGEYYAANSASELEKVFNNLPTALITRQETLEISVLFAALAGLLLLGSLLLSQLWHPLP